jgi:hypothetical protein
MRGIEVSVVRLFGAVALLMIILFVFGKTVRPIQAIIEDVLQLKELTDFEKAVQCAYYMCKYGCGYGGTQRISFDELNCNLDFCKKIPIELKEGESKKVCGHASEQFPVELEVDGASELRIDVLDIYCIIPIDSLIYRSYEKGVVDVDTKFIVEVSGKKCIIEGRGILDACDDKKNRCGAASVRLKEGSYYIWSDKIGDDASVLIWSEPHYTSLDLGEEKEVTFEEGKFYRIKLKYEDGERNAFVETRISNCPPLDGDCYSCFSCIDGKLGCDDPPGVYSKCAECLKSEGCPNSDVCNECKNLAECDVRGFRDCFSDWEFDRCQDYFAAFPNCKDSCYRCFNFNPYIDATVKYQYEDWRTTSELLEVDEMMSVEVGLNHYLYIELKEIFENSVKLKISYFYFVE